VNPDALGRALGARVVARRPVAGGDVNRAEHVRLADGREAFVKHRPGAPAGTWRAEAAGLRWLRVPGGPGVPEVLAVHDDGHDGFLALEWLPPSRPAADHDERLGRGLAALHAAGAPSFGLDHDNWIGPLPQPNAPCTTWPAFLGRRRLEPLIRAAVDAGRLGPADARAGDRLIGRLPHLCGPPEPPARLHGDLWSGNAHAGPDGGPVLVDPAVYGGHREMDLATMRLFGGFGRRVLAAYAEVLPPAPGHEDRVPLCQLPPLLVHALLFGGGYVASVRRTLARFGGDA